MTLIEPRAATRMFRALIGLLTLAAVACAPGTGATPKAGSAMPSTVVDPYLKIQSALAQDSVEGVRANAGQIATAATALGAPAMKIDTAAVQLASATELEDARSKFATLRPYRKPIACEFLRLSIAFAPSAVCMGKSAGLVP